MIPSLLVALVLVAFASPSQAQKVRPEFFGMHDSQIATGATPRVKLGSIRLWDSGTSWRQIETLPGLYDWTGLDAAVAKARAAKLRPLLVLGQTPQFHAENPMAPGAYGDGASSMPRLAAWRAYVTAAATRYGTTVDYQVWNEPNVINYWTGSVAQMAQLTAVTSQAVKAAAGRGATVVAPSFPLRMSGQQSWFKKYWRATSGGKGMASYVDVVAVQLYPLAHEAPEASLKLLAFAKRALPKPARAKPLWNTEINYGLRGGPPAQKIPNAKQAAYVARTLVLNAAGQIHRMYWYAWAQGKIANTHLVQANRTTLTPAGRAWDQVHGWLLGTTIGNCVQAKTGKLKGLYTCTARKSRTEVRRIYWKPSGKAVKLTTNKTTKKWTKLGGKVTKRKGSYVVKVGYSPIMVTSRR
ncbi:hypothetical protein LRP67_03510 [Nocardioides sp. cx-169]|uniref:hypothetical protein n=1 Tax=Nocardioides sp. cx-169 TaxID=2899080 RepID=UPI001E552B1A|nr:hypothetical protein [Nocardioides sp. cx-169]MCD4533146.1 hypothetical protein [Nocardioides sp. cx-169]